MAIEGPQPVKLMGFTASADLSAKQYYAVKISGANTVTVCSAVTDQPIGILQNKPASGQSAEIVVLGMTKVNSDAALSRGNSIGTAADGQLAAYTAADTTKYNIGTVTVASGAAGGFAVAMVSCMTANRFI